MARTDTSEVIFRPRAIAALVSDCRGAGFVQMLILVVVLALGTLGANKLLGNRVGNKLGCTGEAIASLTAGGAPCLDEGGPPLAGLPGGGGANDEAGDPRGANGGDDIQSGDPVTGDG